MAARDKDPGLVEYDGGLKLTGAPLWLDARRPVPLSFVSSAHALNRHQRIITSARTADLLAHRLGSSEALASPMGRSFSLGELSLELIPAGHVVGSAQLLVEWRGLRLLYCGGVQTEPNGVAEPWEGREADILVLDCPYDAKPYVFPSRARTAADLVAWIREVLSETPVIFASPLGTAQELVGLFGRMGIQVRVHRHVARWNRNIRAAGIDPGPAPELRTPAEGEVVVLAPPETARSASLERLAPSRRRALVSGRALVEVDIESVGAEAAFPLSSHADSKALRKLVRGTGAHHVYLGPRHSERFESSLRRMGLGVTRFAISAKQAQLALF
jgi:putative mRNA 3-end processing factor